VSETELDLARRIAAGTARSPTTTPEFTWFALRWSGTAADGTAWRDALDEHVYRPAEITLSQDMQSRLSGLPLMFLHPPKGTLDSKAFERSVIGTLAFGYVATPDGIQDDAGTELWTMARVYSQDAIKALETGELSTSPAVVFTPRDGNETIDLADGTHILLEKNPGTLSHLSVVPAGVWDRGALPCGVRLDSTEGQRPMAETEAEKKTREEREDKARKDAEAAGNVDKVLKHLDDIRADIGAIGKRLDALEKPGKRADAEADPERDEWMREDAVQCARDDAEEARETERLQREKGMAEPVAADAARKARRDRVKARRDMQHRHDTAAETTAQAATRREVDAANIDAQARADSVAHAWGMRAPPPMQGEATLAYRVRLARHHQQHCTEPSFKSLDLAALAATQPAALAGIEARIYADSLAASASPITEDERLIPRTAVDPTTGHRITTFRGRHTFIYDLKAPTMRVTRFFTPQSGRAA
jgi:hypothetical protein